MSLSSTRTSGVIAQENYDNNYRNTVSLATALVIIITNKLHIPALSSPSSSVTTNLILRLGEFHVVKDSEDDFEGIIPPLLKEGVPIRFEDLKHHCQTPVSRWKWFMFIHILLHHQHVLKHHLTHLVLTSSLHLLIMHDSSKSTGNHPFTHNLSSSDTFINCSWSPECSRNNWIK